MSDYFRLVGIGGNIGGCGMKYPKLLQKGDTIGICAPSSGASGEVLSARLDNAIRNIKALDYDVIESASVRCDDKCVSASSETRAAEFMDLYENSSVATIIPPWVCADEKMNLENHQYDKTTWNNYDVYIEPLQVRYQLELQRNREDRIKAMEAYRKSRKGE
jgi:hypothetical protein